MRNKVGMNEKDTKQIVDEIFGDNGLIGLIDSQLLFFHCKGILDSDFLAL
jgi:hypothetical protein